MGKLNNADVLDLLKQVWQKPTYPVYQRVGARLSESDGLAQSVGQRRLRIAILSSFNVDPIKPYIQIGCLERSIWADVFIPGFNQFAQQILSPESDLYSFDPEVCFLHLSPEALIDGGEHSSLQADDVEALIQALSGFMRAFRDRCRADLVVSNFATPGRFPYSLNSEETTRPYQLANDKLVQAAKKVPGVHVLDYEALTAYHGKESVADERWRHIARMDLSDKFLPKMASKILATVIAIRGMGRKCIVLDLDNTLWGGIVGEDGPSGVQLGAEYPGSAFIEFQHSLLALHRRGVLLAINSKNNESDALEVLAQHPSMVLRPEHFSAMQINWRDKCENIESIAGELNIGLESMVFIDDSPAERELMRRLRPEVLTPEWPGDVVSFRAKLEGLCDFETLSITAEDRNRGAMYATLAQREEFKKRTGSLEEYLFGLKIEVTISQAEEADADRVHQLVNKTNQFNLTTRRYSYSDVQAFLHRKDALVYVLRNQDCFGDNGLVAIAVLITEGEEVQGSTWKIDSFLMSCRVFGRSIEAGFLKQIAGELKDMGCRKLIGEFVPTSKNALVQDFYPGAGFHSEATTDGSSRWILDLSTYVPPDLPWLEIKSAVSAIATGAT